MHTDSDTDDQDVPGAQSLPLMTALSSSKMRFAQQTISSGNRQPHMEPTGSEFRSVATRIRSCREHCCLTSETLPLVSCGSETRPTELLLSRAISQDEA